MQVLAKTGNVSFITNYYRALLMCGVKTWPWTKGDINRLMAAEMRELRATEGKNQGRMRTKILRESVDKYIGR